MDARRKFAVIPPKLFKSGGGSEGWRKEGPTRELLLRVRVPKRSIARSGVSDKKTSLPRFSVAGAPPARLAFSNPLRGSARHFTATHSPRTHRVDNHTHLLFAPAVHVLQGNAGLAPLPPWGHGSWFGFHSWTPCSWIFFTRGTSAQPRCPHAGHVRRSKVCGPCLWHHGIFNFLCFGDALFVHGSQRS